MKRATPALLLFFCFFTPLSAQQGKETNWALQFAYWAQLDAGQKSTLLVGVYNGFYVGSATGPGGACMPGQSKGTAFVSSDCMRSMAIDQARAMVDKHYRDHPEQWSMHLGATILKVLTMQGGPCEGLHWEARQTRSNAP